MSRWSKMVLSSTVRLGHVELGLDLLQRRLGHIRKLMQHGHQVVLLDHLHAGERFGRRGVHALQLGPVRRRPEDLGVEHARLANVACVQGLAGDLVPAIPPQQWFAHHGMGRDSLQARLRLHMPFDLLPLGQLAVGDALVLVLPVKDHAVFGDQLGLRHLERFRRQLQQDRPGLSRGGLQGGAEDARGHANRTCPCPRGTARCRP